MRRGRVGDGESDSDGGRHRLEPFLLERPVNRVVPHGTVDEQERTEDFVADAERYVAIGVDLKP
jgi:hypothetical protein